MKTKLDLIEIDRHDNAIDYEAKFKSQINSVLNEMNIFKDFLIELGFETDTSNLK